MIKAVNWDQEVAEDYRQRIIVDPDNPILAFKANRDRYTNLPNQSKYAGLPHLGSKQSEDALTWNVFRSLQKAKALNIVTDRLKIGEPRALLLWTLAPEIDEVNAELQYVTGSLIRKFDGVFRGQITEPDVVMLGTSRVAVVECKLSKRDEALAHVWEGILDSVEKRRPIYEREIPNLLSEHMSNGRIAPVYQLVRVAFYAAKLGMTFGVEPVVVSLANRENWSREIHKIGKSPSQLWDIFCNEILKRGCVRCESLTWQDVAELIEGKSLNALSAYLSTHPCLYASTESQ